MLIGGQHTISATWTLLNSNDNRPFRQCTIRAEDNAAGNIEMSGNGTDTEMYIKTDEAFTVGPNAGTFVPSRDLWLKGTAGDIVFYIGTEV